MKISEQKTKTHAANWKCCGLKGTFLHADWTPHSKSNSITECMRNTCTHQHNISRESLVNLCAEVAVAKFIKLSVQWLTILVR